MEQKTINPKTRFLKIYLRLWKYLAITFLLGMLITGFAIYDADPSINTFRLDQGESASMGIFYAEHGEDIQIGFTIDKVDGSHYKKNLDNLDFNNQDYLVQVIVERSDSLSFEDATKVADFSGEHNGIEFTSDAGFYKITVINTSSHVIDLIIGQTTFNHFLIFILFFVWIIFGIIMTIVHFVTSILILAIIGYGVFLLLKYFEDKYEKNQREFTVKETIPTYENTNQP